METTIPPFSAPAWASFMTGMNPGKHGIFGFISYDMTQYTHLSERIVNATPLAGRTFWDILGKLGYKVGIVTVPVTYPTWAVNGFMLSGYPCPDTHQNYTFPPEYAKTLTTNYNYPREYYRSAAEDQVMCAGPEMMERRISLTLKLISEEKLDIVVVVLGEIDTAHHEFWKYLDPDFEAYHTDRRLKYQDAIKNHYIEADRQLGRVLAELDDNSLIVIMSDHGGGPHAKKCFHVNAWLKEQGWLALKKKHGGTMRSAGQWLRNVARHIPGQEVIRQHLPLRVVAKIRTYTLNIADVDWSRTSAYRFTMYPPTGGIVINLKGRQPEGFIEAGSDYDEVRHEIIQALQKVVDPETGEHIVRIALPREEVYSGPHVEDVPDIIFVLKEGYQSERHLDLPLITPTPQAELEHPSGQHTLKGIFIAKGKGVRQDITVENPRIIDIAPTCLFALGASVPSDIDGRILHEIFEPKYFAEKESKYVEAENTLNSEDYPYTKAEEAQILEKLSRLGYI